MLPVFKEYKNMIESFGIDLSMFDEEKLWVDNLIVKGFNKDGKEVKILRLKVNDDLEYSASYYYKTRTKKGEKFKELIVPKNEDLITWNDLYNIYEAQIRERERESLDVIKNTINKYSNYSIILPTSMGKDSKLTEYLLSQITTNYQAIFNNTTLDSVDVYKEVKNRKDIKIITPKDKQGNNLSFYKSLSKWGMPSRFSRWCCSIFKEGGTVQYMKDKDNIIHVLGMRNEESNTRANYDFEWKNINWKNKTWVGLLPIRKWTELELWLYTLTRKIPINTKYLKGYSRVGCHIACPFYNKSTWILDKYYYKNQYDRFHNILHKDFTLNEKWCRVNCTEEEYHLKWNGGMIRANPTDEVIEEFMNYKGLDNKELALQYFNKDCYMCGKKAYQKDVVAMNLKYFGRNIDKFKCKKCLMKEFNWTKEDWNNQIKEFKQQECKLF